MVKLPEPVLVTLPDTRALESTLRVAAPTFRFTSFELVTREPLAKMTEVEALPDPETFTAVPPVMIVPELVMSTVLVEEPFSTSMAREDDPDPTLIVPILVTRTGRPELPRLT